MFQQLSLQWETVQSQSLMENQEIRLKNREFNVQSLAAKRQVVMCHPMWRSHVQECCMMVQIVYHVCLRCTISLRQRTDSRDS